MMPKAAGSPPHSYTQPCFERDFASLVPCVRRLQSFERISPLRKKSEGRVMLLQIRNPKSEIENFSSSFLLFYLRRRLTRADVDRSGSGFRSRGGQDWICFELLDGFVFIHLLHQFNPGWQSGFATGFLVTQSYFFVESDPDSGHQRRCVSNEPCVREVIGCPG